MTHIETHQSAGERRERLPTSLTLLVDIIRDNPRGTESDHRAAFKKRILSEGYEDYLNAALNMLFSLEYRRAESVANPPTKEEIAEKRAERSKSTKSQRDKIKKVAETFADRVLGRIMPNGKTVRDCTGVQLVKFGREQAKDADMLIRIGERCGRRTVGRALTKEAIQELLAA